MSSIYDRINKFIEYNSYLIDEKYAKSIFFELSKIIPIIEDKTRILITLESSFQENSYIKEFLKKEDKILKGKEEVFRFLNGLIGYLEVKLYNLVLNNPKGYLIAVYRILDYNLQMTPSVLKIVNEDLDSAGLKDKNIKILTHSLNSFKQNVKTEEFKKTLSYVEDSIATDKQAFQKLINYILSYDLRYSDVNIQSNIDVEALIELARGIYRALSIRQEMISDIEESVLELKNQKINIRIAKPIIDKDFYKYYNFNPHSFEDTFEFNDEINKVMRNFFGIDNNAINSAIKKFIKGEIHLPGIILFDDKGLLGFLSEIFSINELDAFKVKNEFTLNDMFISEVPKDLSLKEGRLLRKSILKIEEGVYICSERVFSFSFAGLSADINEGNIFNKEFEKEIFKYIHKQHLDFEKSTIKLLKNNIRYQAIIGGVNEKYFNGIELPGEIDILLLKDNTLFVIECKAFPMKFNISNILSEVRRVKNIKNSKSIQQKLKLKLDFLKENKSILENTFKYKVIKIEGIIVTKNPSLASQTKMGFFDVIPSSQLINYINKNT